MQITRDDRIRMERAHVLAWPALRSTNIHGWLWRASGGGSQRANSVSTIDFTGNDLPAAIANIEARYHSLGAPTRFQTFDDTSPAILPEVLRARHYTASETTITMVRHPDRTVAPANVKTADHPSAEWLEVYLGAITESRRATNHQILSAIPRPSAFFAAYSRGQAISTALCVIGANCAVVECVATRPEARRQGGAATVMQALLSWVAQQDANLIGLQVVASNKAAVSLYEALGFVPCATNQFWLSPPN